MTRRPAWVRRRAAATRRRLRRPKEQRHEHHPAGAAQGRGHRDHRLPTHGPADAADADGADGTDAPAATPTAPTAPPTATPPTAADADGTDGGGRRRDRRLSVSALELLSGDAQTFLAKVWASRVHVHHTDPAGLVGLLSFDDVDHLLTGTAIRTPAVRIAKDGSVLPASAYTRHATPGRPAADRSARPRARCSTLFDDGATVVLQGLHRYWEPLGALVADLELALGHPCQANAYLTPPGSQGFAVHSDSHDVFVFQTHGSKVWEVHERRTEQQTVVLEPGVSMYLPTGTPHAARAAGHRLAARHDRHQPGHLAATSSTAPLAGVLDESGAQHLPAGYLDDPALLADGLAERLETLAAALRGLDPAAVADAEVRRFLTGRTLWQRGGLRDRIAARDLDRHHRRCAGVAGHPCVLRPEGDRLRVLLGDRELLDARPTSRRPSSRSAAPATLTPADLAPRRAEPAGAVPPPGARGAARSRRRDGVPLRRRQPRPRRAAARHRLHGPRVPARRERRALGHRRAARRAAARRGQGRPARPVGRGRRPDAAGPPAPRRRARVRASGSSRPTPTRRDPWMETGRRSPRPRCCSTSTSTRWAAASRPG